ncbi:9585_t:CDS:2, partial [Acaulospora colombiana]
KGRGKRKWVKGLNGVKTRDYDEAKEEMLKYFGSPHERPRYTMNDLLTLVSKQAGTPLENAHDLNLRCIKFDVIANHLLANQRVTEEFLDRQFFLSIPEEWRDPAQLQLKSRNPKYDTRNKAFSRAATKATVSELLTPDWYKPQAVGDARTVKERLATSKSEVRGKDTDSSGVMEIIERLGSLDISSDAYARTYAALTATNPSAARIIAPPQPKYVHRPPTPGASGGEIHRPVAERQTQLQGGSAKKRFAGGRSSTPPSRARASTPRGRKSSPDSRPYERISWNAALIATLERGSRSKTRGAREAASPYNQNTRPTRPANQRQVKFQPKANNIPIPSVGPTPTTASPAPARATSRPSETNRAPRPPAVPEIQMEVEETRPEAKRTGPLYRYVSEAEENANASVIMAKILKMPLPQNLTLGDLCGVAPSIRKSFTDLCRAKRVSLEPNRKPTDTTDKVVSAPLVMNREPAYSKPLPKIRFTLNGMMETALLDTGSQVNLFTEDFVQRAGVPLNENHRISMSGVNGGSDQSMGVCEYVVIEFGPVKTKSHFHVFKVAPFAAILGQPFIGDHVIATTDDGDTYRVMLRDFHDLNCKVSIALHSNPRPKPLDISVSTNVVMADRVSAMIRPISAQDWEAVANGRIEEIDMTDEDWENDPGGSRGGACMLAIGHEFEWGGEAPDDGRAARMNMVATRSAAEELQRSKKWLMIQKNERGQAIAAKYKTVDRKINPAPGVTPENAKTLRKFPENPLDSLPDIPLIPPPFRDGQRVTKNRLEELRLNTTGFLTAEELRIFEYILLANENAIAFDESEKGQFREDYFSPYIIPTMPHTPWAESMIPIPPSIRDQVNELLREKIKNGTYERTESTSYRSRWFTVKKKNGKIRIVHNLEPLNAVAIKDIGLPPDLDEFAEGFAGRSIYSAFDVFSGFDNRKLAVESRDLTTFETRAFGTLRLTVLPQGYSNSPSEFQRCMLFLLQDEIPDIANVFIDDLGVKGPPTRYEREDGTFETVPGHPNIRRFVWEHALDVNRVLHRVGHAGATVSGNKIQLAREEMVMVGQRCTYEGRVPDTEKVAKILRWPVPRNATELRGFLGTCAVVRIWIKDYSKIAKPLSRLTAKDADWEWGDEEQDAMDQLKELVTHAPCITPIDYRCGRTIILAVDSSKIAVGFILYQLDQNNRKRPARFGSLTFNDRESRYSQPKLELYGIFRALKKWRHLLIGVKNFVLETDARYIKGMLNAPDEVPNTTLNRWIEFILLFTFTLKHVPAKDFAGRKEKVIERPLGGERVARRFRAVPLAGERSLGEWNTDEELEKVKGFLETLERPEGLDEREMKSFLKYARQFFIGEDGDMYRRAKSGDMHLKVVWRKKRAEVLRGVHEEMGHRGLFATRRHLIDRYWWPEVYADVEIWVRGCTKCQKFSDRKITLPVRPSSPVQLFRKFYVDVMYMPPSNGYKYVVLARDEATTYAEGRMLRAINAPALAQFLMEEIITRWGAIKEITTDNGPEFGAAVKDPRTGRERPPSIPTNAVEVLWSAFPLVTVLPSRALGRSRDGEKSDGVLTLLSRTRVPPATPDRCVPAHFRLEFTANDDGRANGGKDQVVSGKRGGRRGGVGENQEVTMGVQGEVREGARTYLIQRRVEAGTTRLGSKLSSGEGAKQKT